MAKRLRLLWPVAISTLLASGYALWRLSAADFDPVGVAEIGTRFSELDPDGSAGYDGQFAYYIAIDPDPRSVAPHLDVPAYRYQRILYPALARVLALGNPALIPWTLLGVNLIAHALAIWAISRVLHHFGFWEGYSLIYGLWVGLVSPVGSDLNEPVSYALVALSWLALTKGRVQLSAIAITLGMFAKETTLLFWAAILIAQLLQRKPFNQIGLLLFGGALYGAWQVWLWATLGSPGLGSGGDMATGFEAIPYMGLWRIGAENLRALALYVAVFGPTIVLPSVAGIIRGVRSALAKRYEAETWALLLNCLLIVFLPNSTFREPLGLMRVATGMMMAIILIGAKQGWERPFKLGIVWTIAAWVAVGITLVYV